MLTEELLRGLCPHAREDYVAALVNSTAVLERWGFRYAQPRHQRQRYRRLGRVALVDRRHPHLVRRLALGPHHRMAPSSVSGRPPGSAGEAVAV